MFIYSDFSGNGRVRHGAVDVGHENNFLWKFNVVEKNMYSQTISIIDKAFTKPIIAGLSESEGDSTRQDLISGSDARWSFVLVN